MMGKWQEEQSIVDLIEKNLMMEIFNLKGSQNKKSDGDKRAFGINNVNQKKHGHDCGSEKKAQKAFTGGMMMDSIPLNWGRTPFNSQIFEIF